MPHRARGGNSALVRRRAADCLARAEGPPVQRYRPAAPSARLEASVPQAGPLRSAPKNSQGSFSSGLLSGIGVGCAREPSVLSADFRRGGAQPLWGLSHAAFFGLRPAKNPVGIIRAGLLLAETGRGLSTQRLRPGDRRLHRIQISAANLYRVYAQDLKQFALIQMNTGREVCRRLREATTDCSAGRGDARGGHRTCFPRGLKNVL